MQEGVETPERYSKNTGTSFALIFIQLLYFGQYMISAVPKSSRTCTLYQSPGSTFVRDMIVQNTFNVTSCVVRCN